MKLFRRQEPKTTHPHAAALTHLSNAHRALMKENLEETRQHLGRAFAAVHHAMPKGTMPMAGDNGEPDTDDIASGPPQSTTAPMAKPINPTGRLRTLNQQRLS